MAEITNDLIYDALKSTQFRFDRIEAGIDELCFGLKALRGHMISIQSDTSNISGILARRDDRLERIERRLELRELAEPQPPLDPAT